jgi:hypothetical protein
MPTGADWAKSDSVAEEKANTEKAAVLFCFSQCDSQIVNGSSAHDPRVRPCLGTHIPW